MFQEYIESARKQFEYYKLLGEKTFDQLADEQLFWQYNKESNSIATIIKHLKGNMLSRWKDFLTTDGEKEWRNRNSEFVNDINSRVHLISMWQEGWECLFQALDSVTNDNITSAIYIRNVRHSVTEAINRQLAHYPYHVGQIVFIGKMVLNDKWTSLSIPKGHSNEYNEKIAQLKK